MSRRESSAIVTSLGLHWGNEASLRGSSSSNTYFTLSSRKRSHVQAGVERRGHFKGAVKWAGSQFECQGDKSAREIDMEVATAAKRRMRSMARHSRSH